MAHKRTYHFYWVIVDHLQTTYMNSVKIKLPKSNGRLQAHLKLLSETVTQDEKLEPFLEESEYVFKAELLHPGDSQIDIHCIQNSVSHPLHIRTYLILIITLFAQIHGIKKTVH